MPLKLALMKTRVPLRNRDRPATIDGYITVRELRSELKKRDGQIIQLRFWTNLLDPELDPAIKLVELYAKHWEHELYFNELKNELKRSRLLKSRNSLCAYQEIIWNFVSLVANEITPELINQALAAAFEELKIETMPRRTNRSCPRTLRQNVIDWPKTKCYQPQYGPIKISIISI